MYLAGTMDGGGYGHTSGQGPTAMLREYGMARDVSNDRKNKKIFEISPSHFANVHIVAP